MLCLLLLNIIVFLSLRFVTILLIESENYSKPYSFS